MSFGEVDTLNMLFDKLDNLFNESQGYYESFLDTNNLYKAGKISDKEFFQKLGDYTIAYSALEFLAIKVMFEMRKALNTGNTTTQSPGLMPGMGNPAMMSGGMTMPRTGTQQNPVGGVPPQIVSANDEFGKVGTLPSPDPSLVQTSQNGCASCGSELRPNAKFCTKCGAKV